MNERRALLAFALLAVGCSEPVGALDGGVDLDGGGVLDGGVDAGVRDAGTDAESEADGGVDAGAGEDPSLIEACAMTCDEGLVCDPAIGGCACAAGNREVSGSCVPLGLPSAGSEPAAVDASAACARWDRARVVDLPLDQDGYVPSAGECPYGQLDATAATDALRVANGLRAMLGLGSLSSTSDTADLQAAQRCGLMVAYAGRAADTYDTSSLCYLAANAADGYEHVFVDGARAPAEAVLQLFLHGDWTHPTSNGTPVFDPRTRRSAFGFFAGGFCAEETTFYVNDVPDWFAHPGPGAVPRASIGDRWVVGVRSHTFAGTPVVEVTRDGASVAVSDVVLDQEEYAVVSFVLGEALVAGAEYEVRLAGMQRLSVSTLMSRSEIVFTTTPVSCASD